MVVIVEFELRTGMESEFETALQHMREQVKKYDGFLGETPCCSIENEKTFVTLSYWRDRESIKAWREDPVPQQRSNWPGKKYLLGTKFACVSLNASMDGSGRIDSRPVIMNSGSSRKSRLENR